MLSFGNFRKESIKERINLQTSWKRKSKLLGTLLLVWGGFLCTSVFASGVEIVNTKYEDQDFNSENPVIETTLTVKWKNSWHNKKNNDAVWIFFKVFNRDGRVRHAKILPGSPRLEHNYNASGVNAAFEIPGDSTGIFVYPSTEHRGDNKWRITLKLSLKGIEHINLRETLFVNPYAIEMVYIPKGGFFIGEPSEELQEQNGAFFQADTHKPYFINSEQAIDVGEGKGNLNYIPGSDTLYKGDKAGPIPADFPKGFDGFYIMKYELNCGNYTDFLNSISDYHSHSRANFGGKNYQDDRGFIAFEDNKYSCRFPGNPVNFISTDDMMAFTDWAALRPMTELEYEKAARGTRKPIEGEFPWGSNSNKKLSRYFNEEGALVFDPDVNESELSDSNLEIFGASYYWVMDLNKSLWERCVSVGSKQGRKFKGSHGNGHITGYFGFADNPDWPNMQDGGLSYRGGGTYFEGMVGSPKGELASRPFGAWGTGPRAIAYGYRAARTATARDEN